MREGIVIEVFKSYVAVMTPEGEFLKVRKDPQLCSLGEEIWFRESDLILPGIINKIKSISLPSVAFQSFAFAAVAFLLISSGVTTYLAKLSPDGDLVPDGFLASIGLMDDRKRQNENLNHLANDDEYEIRKVLSPGETKEKNQKDDNLSTEENDSLFASAPSSEEVSLIDSELFNDERITSSLSNDGPYLLTDSLTNSMVNAKVINLSNYKSEKEHNNSKDPNMNNNVVAINDTDLDNENTNPRDENFTNDVPTGIKPTPSEKPERPGNSGNSGKPEKPEKPGNSGKPEKPEKPGNSGKPEKPEEPGNSGNSGKPEKPGISEVPEGGLVGSIEVDDGKVTDSNKDKDKDNENKPKPDVTDGEDETEEPVPPPPPPTTETPSDINATCSKDGYYYENEMILTFERNEKGEVVEVWKEMPIKKYCEKPSESNEPPVTVPGENSSEEPSTTEPEPSPETPTDDGLLSESLAS